MPVLTAPHLRNILGESRSDKLVMVPGKGLGESRFDKVVMVPSPNLLSGAERIGLTRGLAMWV